LPARNLSEEGVNSLKIMKVAWLVSLSIAVLFVTGTAASAWTPPIGIPAPSFGIIETAKPFTHYVDNTSPQATDTNNPNGSQPTLRQPIPAVLASGSVVEVHGGPYIYNTSGPVAFTASGTAANPVFVRGVGMPWIQGPGPTSQGWGDRTFYATGSY